jgi:hypothetical protein
MPRNKSHSNKKELEANLKETVLQLAEAKLRPSDIRRVLINQKLCSRANAPTTARILDVLKEGSSSDGTNSKAENGLEDMGESSGGGSLKHSISNILGGLDKLHYQN